MPPDRSKIVDRVRKLLALSTSSNPNESAVAAAQAARLMARYQIESVEEVEAESDPVNENRDLNVEIGKAKRPITWKWNLAWVVGASAQCKPYMLNRIVGDEIVALTVAFIGRRSDAEVCAYLFRYLLTELKTLHHARRPVLGSPIQQYIPGAATPLIDRDYQRRWTRDFYMGAVATLHDRMTAAREEVFEEHDTQGPTSTALARLDLIAHAVDLSAADMGLHYVKAREVDIRSQQGYASGVMAGREVNLAGEHDYLALPEKKP